MSNLRPVWIDTDTGVDDAFALVSSFQLSGIEVVGISAVCGNVEIEKTFRNARNVVSLCGKENVPVYKGAEKPLIVPLSPAYNVHGEDGLGGVVIPESKAPIEKENAVDALYKKAKELNGELTIAAVGPLTNIAIALYKYPDFPKYIKEIVIMGGSIAAGGNCSTSAEFNIYGDPHAAQTVMKSGMSITLFPLDVTLKALLSREEIDTLKKEDDAVGQFCYKSSEAPMSLFRNLGLGDYMCLHDTCPIAYLSHPELFSGKKCSVYVETQSKLSIGRTVSDCFAHSEYLFKNKNCTVMLNVDRDKLAKIVLDSFKAYV
ncbi:MAG: nucleoside hydrolase [Erysipelotrichaceae bacterium]|nr:nucleoside hydrolase [Erysipelotrichaceae bacterium]